MNRGIRRREFLRHAALAAGAVACGAYLPKAAAGTASADSRIDVLLDEPLGTISPNIYGHFTEHLGGVIYDGLWVGENSPVANLQGIRRRLVEEMRKIKAPVVRYPGGCFADSYNWRDGVGPADKRPRRTNFWNDAETKTAPENHKYESNRFGTNEFIRFCRLIGAQPYLAANLRSLPAEEFYHWVEYCNSPAGSTSLAEMRAAAGSPEPFNVRFWGVGNESWGCGGNFTPQEYAVEFRRFTTWLPHYGPELSLVASGPYSEESSWTRGFFEELLRKGADQLRSIYGLSLHHYAWNLSRGRTTDWDKGKGSALEFDPVDWYELLREGQRVEDIVVGHWRTMGEFDEQHRVKLIVDEWGPWYHPGSEATPGNLLEQIPTLRDAVFSAMTLDVFNRHPEKVAMANCAQLINCLNSLYLAHEEKFCVTPVGHVFAMYAAHQGGQGVRTAITAPALRYDRDGKPATFWGLQGSASLQGKEVVLTVVNPHVSEPRETRIALRGGRVSSASLTTLTSTDLQAHNTFAEPAALEPQTKKLDARGAELTVVLPAASVNKLTLVLG
ncbi:MAG: alpha-L-arabinofuranosidase C-terminal domain-containing protein [Candidatus Acidiferrum sp.]